MVSIAALRADELAAVRTELSRIDTKAGLLGTGVLAGLAWGAAALTPDKSLAVTVCGWGAEATAAAAGIVLLLVVRPRLRGRHGFLAWSGHPVTSWVRLERLAANDHDHQHERHAELTELAAMVKHKYRLLRLAVDMLLIAAALAAVTIIVDIVLT
ncbi:Pycsar system effector family protein [Stackebrandtia nassauensis]|uniref:Pycsar effector protein domain-containing protein n=1 Tax=Stackebrandtia nassauensis (strain DSM 44728 / CIP 108903 / NRRL B-16338 / NBRC 102104 / LLR-40K-21) TaxID=446470 RepID=D3Q2V5_STANL|nr:Pycsar system effector family protein [Stackebrandtia nassauensis]ADD45856.1 hypothetical protein Snas_6235 [Stackebrandtia nassauensis DSM 44728]